MIIREHSQDEGAGGSAGIDTYWERRGDELYAVHQTRRLWWRHRESATRLWRQLRSSDSPAWTDADGTKDQAEEPEETYHMSCKCYLDKVPQKEWLNNVNPLSHSSGGHKAKIKVPAWPCSLCRCRGKVCSRPLCWCLVLSWLATIQLWSSQGILPRCRSVSKSPLRVRRAIILGQGATLLQ